MPIPSKKTSSAPKTARERVYQTLKQWIENNTLKQGEKIYDTELASYFEVSRTPVREAMQLLADQKLIEIRPGKESFVAPIDLSVVRENYMILGQLQILALRFAFPKITEQDLEQLERINQTIVTESISDYLSADNTFHQYIQKIAGNPFLDSFCNMLSTHITRFQFTYLENFTDYSKEGSFQSHQRIIDALRAKDLDAAEKELYENFVFMLPQIDRFEKQI
mgnify:CR=1 FL=1